MKSVLKKITATAMAFAILGTGTAITNNMSTKTNTGLVAHAGPPPQYCSHNSGWYWSPTYRKTWQFGKLSFTFKGYQKCCNICGSPI